MQNRWLPVDPTARAVVVTATAAGFDAHNWVWNGAVWVRQLGDLGGRTVVAGVREGGTYTSEPIPSVPFFPQNGMGQVIAIGAVAVSSAALTQNREHTFQAEQNCWIRIGAGAAALDYPLMIGSIFVYTPLNAGEVVSVIQMAALGGNFYIGQSEAT